MNLFKFFKNRLLKRKWKHHADNRRFDWRWDSIHYNRIALVNLILSRYKDPRYLEIGCSTNALFDSVLAAKKTGVDPIKGGTVRKTSDEFFAGNSETFDVVFIDGLHTYQQVRRDLVNSIRFVSKGGWIMLHDMLPRDWTEQHTPIVSTGAWTGDVWKVAFELINTPGLEFRLLKIDHGVGVVRVLDESPVLADLTSELKDKQFSYFYDNIKNLPLADWEHIQGWLRD